MFAIDDKDIDAGIALSEDMHSKGFSPDERQKLIRVINSMDVKRVYDHEKFPEALRLSLDEHRVLDPTQRKRFKSAIGKFHSERKARIKRNKLVKVPAERIPVVLEGRQYAFAGL